MEIIAACISIKTCASFIFFSSIKIVKMKPERILESETLDILFEHRNKAYGAYSLRKAYPRRLIAALGWVLLLVGIFIVGNLLSKRFSPAAQIDDLPRIDWALQNLPPSEPVQPVPPKAPRKQRAASQHYATLRLVKEAPEPMPEMEALEKQVEIGTAIRAGQPAIDPGPPVVAAEAVAETNSTEAEPAVYKKVEKMPEFPGGELAMRRWLQRNMRFNTEEQAAGTRIEIQCRFVIDKEGKVTAIEIIKGAANREYAREIKRVVAKMPDWMPGVQNGKQVAVYFTLPVIVEVPGE